MEDIDDVMVRRNNNLEALKNQTKSKPPHKVAKERFLDLPEDILIEYENASSYIKQQNHNIEHMMGVSDKRCDNARVILKL